MATLPSVWQDLEAKRVTSTIEEWQTLKKTSRPHTDTVLPITWLTAETNSHMTRSKVELDFSSPYVWWIKALERMVKECPSVWTYPNLDTIAIKREFQLLLSPTKLVLEDRINPHVLKSLWIIWTTFINQLEWSTVKTIQSFSCVFLSETERQLFLPLFEACNWVFHPQTLTCYYNSLSFTESIPLLAAWFDFFSPFLIQQCLDPMFFTTTTFLSSSDRSYLFPELYITPILPISNFRRQYELKLLSAHQRLGKTAPDQVIRPNEITSLGINHVISHAPPKWVNLWNKLAAWLDQHVWLEKWLTRLSLSSTSPIWIEAFQMSRIQSHPDIQSEDEESDVYWLADQDLDRSNWSKHDQKLWEQDWTFILKVGWVSKPLDQQLAITLKSYFDLFPPHFESLPISELSTGVFMEQSVSKFLNVSCAQGATFPISYSWKFSRLALHGWTIFGPLLTLTNTMGEILYTDTFITKDYPNGFSSRISNRQIYWTEDELNEEEGREIKGYQLKPLGEDDTGLELYGGRAQLETIRKMGQTWYESWLTSLKTDKSFLRAIQNQSEKVYVFIYYMIQEDYKSTCQEEISLYLIARYLDNPGLFSKLIKDRILTPLEQLGDFLEHSQWSFPILGVFKSGIESLKMSLEWLKYEQSDEQDVIDSSPFNISNKSVWLETFFYLASPQVLSFALTSNHMGFINGKNQNILMDINNVLVNPTLMALLDRYISTFFKLNNKQEVWKGTDHHLQLKSNAPTFFLKTLQLCWNRLCHPEPTSWYTFWLPLCEGVANLIHVNKNKNETWLLLQSMLYRHQQAIPAESYTQLFQNWKLSLPSHDHQENHWMKKWQDTYFNLSDRPFTHANGLSQCVICQNQVTVCFYQFLSQVTKSQSHDINNSDLWHKVVRILTQWELQLTAVNVAYQAHPNDPSLSAKISILSTQRQNIWWAYYLLDRQEKSDASLWDNILTFVLNGQPTLKTHASMCREILLARVWQTMKPLVPVEEKEEEKTYWGFPLVTWQQFPVTSTPLIQLAQTIFFQRMKGDLFTNTVPSEKLFTSFLPFFLMILKADWSEVVETWVKLATNNEHWRKMWFQISSLGLKAWSFDPDADTPDFLGWFRWNLFNSQQENELWARYCIIVQPPENQWLTLNQDQIETVLKMDTLTNRSFIFNMARSLKRKFVADRPSTPRLWQEYRQFCIQRLVGKNVSLTERELEQMNLHHTYPLAFCAENGVATPSFWNTEVYQEFQQLLQDLRRSIHGLMVDQVQTTLVHQWIRTIRKIKQKTVDALKKIDLDIQKTFNELGQETLGLLTAGTFRLPANWNSQLGIEMYQITQSFSICQSLLALFQVSDKEEPYPKCRLTNSLFVSSQNSYTDWVVRIEKICRDLQSLQSSSSEPELLSSPLFVIGPTQLSATLDTLHYKSRHLQRAANVEDLKLFLDEHQLNSSSGLKILHLFSQLVDRGHKSTRGNEAWTGDMIKFIRENTQENQQVQNLMDRYIDFKDAAEFKPLPFSKNLKLLKSYLDMINKSYQQLILYDQTKNTSNYTNNTIKSIEQSVLAQKFYTYITNFNVLYQMVYSIQSHLQLCMDQVSQYLSNLAPDQNFDSVTTFKEIILIRYYLILYEKFPTLINDLLEWAMLDFGLFEARIELMKSNVANKTSLNYWTTLLQEWITQLNERMSDINNEKSIFTKWKAFQAEYKTIPAPDQLFLRVRPDNYHYVYIFEQITLPDQKEEKISFRYHACLQTSNITHKDWKLQEWEFIRYIIIRCRVYLELQKYLPRQEEFKVEILSQSQLIFKWICNHKYKIATVILTGATLLALTWLSNKYINKFEIEAVCNDTATTNQICSDAEFITLQNKSHINTNMEDIKTDIQAQNWIEQTQQAFAHEIQVQFRANPKSLLEHTMAMDHIPNRVISDLVDQLCPKGGEGMVDAICAMSPTDPVRIHKIGQLIKNLPYSSDIVVLKYFFQKETQVMSKVFQDQLIIQSRSLHTSELTSDSYIDLFDQYKPISLTDLVDKISPQLTSQIKILGSFTSEKIKSLLLISFGSQQFQVFTSYLMEVELQQRGLSVPSIYDSKQTIINYLINYFMHFLKKSCTFVVENAWIMIQPIVFNILEKVLKVWYNGHTMLGELLNISDWKIALSSLVLSRLVSLGIGIIDTRYIESLSKNHKKWSILAKIVSALLKLGLELTSYNWVITTCVSVITVVSFGYVTVPVATFVLWTGATMLKLWSYSSSFGRLLQTKNSRVTSNSRVSDNSHVTLVTTERLEEKTDCVMRLYPEPIECSFPLPWDVNHQYWSMVHDNCTSRHIPGFVTIKIYNQTDLSPTEKSCLHMKTWLLDEYNKLKDAPTPFIIIGPNDWIHTLLYWLLGESSHPNQTWTAPVHPWLKQLINQSPIITKVTITPAVKDKINDLVEGPLTDIKVGHDNVVAVYTNHNWLGLNGLTRPIVDQFNVLHSECYYFSPCPSESPIVLKSNQSLWIKAFSAATHLSQWVDLATFWIDEDSPLSLPLLCI